MNVRYGRFIGSVSAVSALLASDRRAVGFGSLEFVRAYLTTMRPYLFFVSGITGVLGLALGPTVAVLPAILLAAAFFVSYGFGQALTDCFQTDTDALSAPYRPLVRGLVSRRDVMLVSLAGLVGVGVVLVAGHPLNLPLVALAVAGLATYTWFKRRWWGGPFYNAWIVALLVPMGLCAASGVAARPLAWPPATGAALLAVFFGYANFVLAGYFKDVDADRATGYHTLPVVFGRRVAAAVSDLFAAAALLFAVLALEKGGVPGRAFTDPAVLALLVSGLVTAVVAQVRLHRVTRDREAHGPISLVVHAYILQLGALTVALKSDWILPVVLFYAAFVVTLRLRPMREQV